MKEMDALKLHLLLNYYPAIGFMHRDANCSSGRSDLRVCRLSVSHLSSSVFFALLTLVVVVTGEIAGRMQESQIDGPRAAALDTVTRSSRR